MLDLQGAVAQSGRYRGRVVSSPVPEIVYVALINTADQERLPVHSDVNDCLVSFLSSVFDLKFRILSHTFAIPIFGLMTKTQRGLTLSGATDGN